MPAADTAQGIPEPARLLLVGGAPRSGTTAVCDLINEHEDVALWAEYPFDELLRQLSGLLVYGQEQIQTLKETETQLELLGCPDIAEVSSASSGAEALSLSQEGAEPLDMHYQMHGSVGLTYPRRYPIQDRFAAIVAAVVKAAVDKPNARIIGTKDPLFFLQADVELILEHFPDAQFIFCLREPEAQINSSVNRRNLTAVGLDNWSKHSLDTMIEEYRSAVRSICSYAARFEGRVFVIKYEDLVGREQFVLDALAAFLRVDEAKLGRLAKANPANRSVLTPAEKKSVRKAFPENDKWQDLELTGSGLSRVHALAPYLYQDLEPAPSVHLSVAGRSLLGLGWGETEENGVWSIDASADLIFAVPEEGMKLLSLTFAVNLSNFSDSQKIRVLLNDAVIFNGMICRGGQMPTGSASWPIISFSGKETFETVSFGPVRVPAGRINVLRLEFPEVRSPKELGQSDDPRRLGVKLQHFGLIAIDAAEASVEQPKLISLQEDDGPKDRPKGSRERRARSATHHKRRTKTPNIRQKALTSKVGSEV